MFAHFGRLLIVLLKFSTHAPGRRCSRASSSKARSASRRARAGPGRAALHRPLRLLGDQRARPRADAAADGGAGAAARQPAAARSARAVRAADRQLASSTAAARSAACCARWTANQAVALLIDQHIQTADAIYVDFFNRPAATTSALAALALRTGAPVIPVFALPLPGGRFRMVYEHAGRAAARRRSRRHPRVHAALHRRARDVRAPLSGAVAVDAPPLARRARAGEHASRACSRLRRAEERRRPDDSRVERNDTVTSDASRDPRAELARRRGHGAAGAWRAVRAGTSAARAIVDRRASRRSRRCSRSRPPPSPDEVLVVDRATRERRSCARRQLRRDRCCCRIRFGRAWVARRAGIAERWGYAGERAAGC